MKMTEYKEIKLGGKKGGIAIVSVEDFDILSKYKWYLDKNGYVQGTVNGKSMKMTHLIMNAARRQIVDHINRIRTDNRRSNLRISTRLLNGQNRGKSKLKTPPSSIYRGIHRRRNGKYNASIILENVMHYLGTFNTELEAVEAWDMFIVHNKLDHIQLNFPDKRNEYLLREYKPYEPKKPKLPYIGIRKRRKVYTAYIGYKGKSIFIGSSKDIVEAAQKYDDYIIKNGIKGKQLNFPNRYPEYFEKEIMIKCEEINENTVKLLLNYKDDKFVIVDKEDYENIKYYKCRISNRYVLIEINGVDFSLHRYLLGVTDPDIMVDHIDSNRLNNKKDNLRSSNDKLNPQNRLKIDGTTSKYIGVHCVKVNNSWRATVINDGKKVFSETYTDEEAAARARDVYIIEQMKGSHYKLNFKWTDNDLITWKKQLNKVKRKFTSSYVGVNFRKDSDRWRSTVYIKNKLIFTSHYTTEEHAARARDLYILENSHIKSKLNFKWTTDEISYWKNKLEESKKLPKSSDYAGVSSIKKTGKWLSTITNKGKIVFRGTYTSEEYAARARDLYIMDKLHDSNPKMNFKWTKAQISKWKKILGMHDH